MENTETLKKSGKQGFVEYVLDRINVKNDSAFRAALCRADNPATESQAWEYLFRWCDLDNDLKRRPYATIAAAIARAKPKTDGSLGIGKAILACYKKEKYPVEAAKPKLRRLLACNSVEEACVILRPLLSLIASRDAQLCYRELLNELIYFGDGERVKQKWAVDFYGRRWDDARVGA